MALGTGLCCFFIVFLGFTVLKMSEKVNILSVPGGGAFDVLYIVPKVLTCFT